MSHRRFTHHRENMMGNSLHNKIYLGRGSALAGKRMRALLVMAACAGAGLAWLALRALR
jgi:hypothetical protein